MMAEPKEEPLRDTCASARGDKDAQGLAWKRNVRLGTPKSVSIYWHEFRAEGWDNEARRRRA
jgi:hypothetical protein